MGYFPESIMPSRLKDESQDVKGNEFVVSAADVNKHDEEIRALQRVIGVRPATFPGKGFSGTSLPSGFSAFACIGDCTAPAPDCSGRPPQRGGVVRGYFP